MERPIFFPLFSMIAGLSTGLIFSRFVPEYFLFLFLALAFCAVLGKSRIPLHLAISCLLFCAANISIKPYLFPEFTSTHIARHLTDDAVIIEGVIDSRPEAMESGSRLYLRTEKIFYCKSSTSHMEFGEDPGQSRTNQSPHQSGISEDKTFNSQFVTGRLMLTVKEGEIRYLTGDRIRFASRIRKPRNYGMPGEFDTERFMAFKRVFATAYVKNTDEIAFIGSSGEFGMQRRVDEIAVHLGKFISNNLPVTESAILRALLLGDMGAVPKTMKDAYTRTGVNHILSISGFHVGIIALFIFQIVLLAAKQSEFLLLYLNMRRFSLVLTLPVLVFYLFLSGTAPATVRSVIMIGVFILAMVIEREADPLDSLMLAAVVILAGSPPALFDLSFQLSFLAFWGIVALTPLFVAPFEPVQGRIKRKLLLFFMASLAATAATIIPVAFYFHRTTLTGLISNFLIVPLLGYGAVVIGFAALPFVYLAPFVARSLLLVAAYLVKISDAIIKFLAHIPMLPLFNPSRLDLSLFYLFLLAITFLKTGKVRRFCCISLLVLFTFSGFWQASPDKGKLALTFFSVGQGESILINFPDGKRMLVDGGGTPGENTWDIGERVLAPALRQLGIDRLDYLVLTHPHPDHLRGLEYVAANFDIGEFWEGGSYPECQEYRELMGVLIKRKIPVKLINAESAPLEIGGARIEPLAPVPRKGTVVPDTDNYFDMNDESLVFRLTSGAFSALLTGDIGHDVEERLSIHPQLLRCTVLKVPHHGSRYSSSMVFLEAASPRIAVISAGYGNNFHLPAQQTLDRLSMLGTRLFRTDLDGAVRVVCEDPRQNIITIRTAGHFR